VFGPKANDNCFSMLVKAPEGACSNGRCTLRFRTGADAPGLLKLQSASTATSGALTLLRTNLFKHTMDCMS